MSESSSNIAVHRHHAMATVFEVRIAGEEPAYAAQACHATFALLDQLEQRLSRFQPDSEIAAISRLRAGESMIVSEPTCACLAIAREMERQTMGAFSPAATARRNGMPAGRWSLEVSSRRVTIEEAPCHLDLGAIGKGFALDRMAEELREWSCPAFLLVAGGSSVLAGAPPPGAEAWSARLSDPAQPDTCVATIDLVFAALGASGLALQGHHITDPRSGKPVTGRRRTWVQAESAAEADALSTALMVLDDSGSDTFAGLRPDIRTWRTAGV